MLSFGVKFERLLWNNLFWKEASRLDWCELVLYLWTENS